MSKKNFDLGSFKESRSFHFLCYDLSFDGVATEISHPVKDTAYTVFLILEFPAILGYYFFSSNALGW